MNTYRAMAITQPGKLELIHKPIPKVQADEVLVKVTACGMCGADLRDIAIASPSLKRVPGHEIVGNIVAKGALVPELWSVGQRVGIGRLGGYCHWCNACRQGQFQLCKQRPIMGVTRDGGYAEFVTAPASGLVAIPLALAAHEAAPILCAGIATSNGLKAAGLHLGQRIAILGVGGLGHLAIQYASKMGLHVTAIGRGPQIAEDVLELGAHNYIDLQASSEALTTCDDFDAIITTIADSTTLQLVAKKLSYQGKLIVLGITTDEFHLDTGSLVGNEQHIIGSITGTPFESEQLLATSLINRVIPWYETISFLQANKALNKLRSGQARFRIVLTMEDNIHAD